MWLAGDAIKRLCRVSIMFTLHNYFQWKYHWGGEGLVTPCGDMQEVAVVSRRTGGCGGIATSPPLWWRRVWQE